MAGGFQSSQALRKSDTSLNDLYRESALSSPHRRNHVPFLYRARGPEPEHLPRGSVVYPACLTDSPKIWDPFWLVFQRNVRLSMPNSETKGGRKPTHVCKFQHTGPRLPDHIPASQLLTRANQEEILASVRHANRPAVSSATRRQAAGELKRCVPSRVGWERLA